MNACNWTHCLLYWETLQAVVECKWSSSGRSVVRSSPLQGSTMFWTVPPSKHSTITGRGKGVTCALYLLSLFSENGLVSSPLFTPVDDHEPMRTVLLSHTKLTALHEKLFVSKFPTFVWDTKARYHLQRTPPQGLILGEINPFHFVIYCFQDPPQYFAPAPPTFFIRFRFSDKNFVCISHFAISAK